jgi:hypothetical protein
MFTDVLGIASHDNVVLVLPTVRHALGVWTELQFASAQRYHDVKVLRRAIILHPVQNHIRLWIPHVENKRNDALDDAWQRRTYHEWYSPYYTRKELRRLASS